MPVQAACQTLNAARPVQSCNEGRDAGYLALTPAIHVLGRAAHKLEGGHRIRAACETGLTLGDAVAALEESSEDDESDAPVLEPGRRDVVRVMNLHKAKG